MSAAVLESDTRFPGAPTSPEIDRTRALVGGRLNSPQAAPVVSNLTGGDRYRFTAIRELMCLACAAGANDALQRVRS